MKKLQYCLSGLMLVIPFVLFSESCSKSTESSGTDTPLNLTKAEIGVVDASGKASFELFRNTYQRETETGNVLVSPLSLQIALMMCANGAVGETYDQIVSAIGYGDYPVADLNRVYRQLSTGLCGVDHLSTLELANSGWVREGYSLLDSYVSAVESDYNGIFRTLDFSLPSSVDVINGWCSEKTHGLIPKVLDEIPAAVKLMLINALYFKSDWSSKFDAGDTRTEDFTDLSGKKQRVEMMHKTFGYDGAESADASMCEFPFGNGSFCLDIILPTAETDFGAFVGDFGYDDYMKMVGKVTGDTYRVSIPKLDIKYSTEMNDVLRDMGMVLPFSDAADFSAMSHTPLCVSSVTQNCRFRMDEKGGEAAAVTTVAMYETAVGPGMERVFTADRPFIYVLREKTSGTILFIGSFTGEE